MGIKLPSLDKIDRAIPTVQQRTVNVPHQSFENEAAALGGVLDKASNMIVKYQTDKAVSEYNQKMMQLEYDALQNPDYEKAPKEFETASKSLINDISKKIPSRSGRNAFISEAKQTSQSSLFKVTDSSMAKFRESERATLAQSLDDLVELSFKTGDLETAVKDVSGRLQSATEAGIIKPTEAQKLKSNFNDKLVATQLSTVTDPHKRLQEIDKFSGQLSSDTYAQLKTATEKDIFDNNVNQTADTLLNKGVDYKSLTENIDRLPAQMREPVKAAYLKKRQEMDKAQSLRDKDILDKYLLSVATGQITVDKIPEFSELSGAAQTRLYNMQQKYIDTQLNRSDKLRQKLDKQRMAQVYLAVQDLLSKGDSNGAEKLLYTEGVDYAVANPTWFQSLRNKVEKPDTTKDLIAPIANESLKKLDPADRVQVQEDLDRWVNEYRARESKDPPAPLVSQIISTLASKAVIDKGFIFDTNKEIYDMTDSELKQAIRVLRDEDPEAVGIVEQHFNNAGIINPTPLEIYNELSHVIQTR